MKKVSSLVSPPPMASPTIFILFLIAAFCLSSVSSSDPDFPYSDHCASFVPESSPRELQSPDYFVFQWHLGYYRAPDQPSLYFNIFTFQLQSFRKTDAEGLFMVDGEWCSRDRSYEEAFSGGLLSSGSRYNLTRTMPRLILRGFWVESTGKLCMVGVGSVDSTTVLKLNNLKNSTTVRSLITGKLDLLGSQRCTLSLLILPEINYHFTLVPEENGNGDFSQSLPLNSPLERSICTFGLPSCNSFPLKYSKKVLSAKNSSLFGESLQYLPKLVSFTRFMCSEEGQRMRLLVAFHNSSRDLCGSYIPFSPNTSMIGEAFWDGKGNQMLFVGCRFSGMDISFDDANVSDCSIIISYRYPTNVSIRNTSYVVGKIWSSKSENESGYFDPITFQQSIFRTRDFLDSKYEYTKIEKSKKLCPAKKPDQNDTKRYAIPDAYYLRFHTWSRNLNRSTLSIFRPRFVGNRPFDPFSEQSRVVGGGKVNISYNVHVGGPLDTVLAEGEIDFEMGSLCMIGCRDINPGNQILSSSMDCEILVKVEFPRLGKNLTHTKGTIESLRSTSDPLYFETFELELAAFGRATARRLDLEIVVVLISTTLACLFILRQLVYVKKRLSFFLSFPSTC